MLQASADGATAYMLSDKSSLGPGINRGSAVGNIYTSVLLDFPTYLRMLLGPKSAFLTLERRTVPFLDCTLGVCMVIKYRLQSCQGALQKYSGLFMGVASCV